MMERPRQQQGMALVEALVASAILGIGLLGAMQLTLKTLSTVRQNRQHMVAQQLAQEAMDCLRTSASMPASLSSEACPVQEILQIQGVAYTRQAQSVSGAMGQLSELKVRVSWPVPPTGHEVLIEWHSSVSVLPAWVGVSLP